MIGVYFSGTGNSKHCIELFLKEYDSSAMAYSIEDEGVIEAIKQQDEIVFAYPIYYSFLPKIVSDFMVHNQNIFKDKRIFIITTMGLFSGDGSGCSARLFKTYGAHIWGGLHLKMPDCIGDEKLLKKSLEENKQIVKKSEAKIRKTVKQVKAGKRVREGLSAGSHILGLFGQRLYFASKTKTYSNKLKIHADACVGCGKCVELCPMENLRLTNGVAQSLGKCTMCYRCVNHCPQAAITLLGNKVHEQSRIEKYI